MLSSGYQVRGKLLKDIDLRAWSILFFFFCCCACFISSFFFVLGSGVGKISEVCLLIGGRTTRATGELIYYLEKAGLLGLRSSRSASRPILTPTVNTTFILGTVTQCSNRGLQASSQASACRGLFVVVTPSRIQLCARRGSCESAWPFVVDMLTGSGIFFFRFWLFRRGVFGFGSRFCLLLNPFSTSVPNWGQHTLIPSDLFLKRGCSTKKVGFIIFVFRFVFRVAIVGIFFFL